MTRNQCLFQLLCSILQGAAMAEDDPERLAKRAFEVAFAALEKMEQAGFVFEENEGEDWTADKPSANVQPADTLPVAMTPALKESIVTYSDGEKTFEGVMVTPGDEEYKKRPAIVIAHDFLGLGDYQKAVARRLADKGYVVLAADLYGQGVRPKSDEEANQLALSLREDVPTMRRRMMAAYRLLTSQPAVDSSKVAALGYSLGGLAAFELARGGARVAGVVSIWGILETKRPEDKLSAQTKVLIFHGALDPLTSAEAVTVFERELQSANIDYQLIKYGGVAHAFTVPAVGTDVSTGFAYDAVADRRSWAGLETFLKEVVPLK